MTASVQKFSQGITVSASDADFRSALESIVDYRGDHTIHLKDGRSIEGYIFSHTPTQVDLYPRVGAAISIAFDEIDSVTFSGEDTAQGKSWEDWQAKKSAERAKLKAQSFE